MTETRSPPRGEIQHVLAKKEEVSVDRPDKVFHAECWTWGLIFRRVERHPLPHTMGPLLIRRNSQRSGGEIGEDPGDDRSGSWCLRDKNKTTSCHGFTES